ncbi:phosphoserine phosphatase SerB [Sphingomonas profundi]|uniref:phosphoserine phosphatase SerB n=1 Tax=Alterirhizorhabdus profundi TaxID=2681549 RepID=UPI0012E8C95F|nr:phosphoserine phosphatase SerB [Sphingomonas profundi]
MLIATVIAGAARAGTLADGDVSACRDALAAAGCAPGVSRWIEAGHAFDLGFAGERAEGRAALEGLIGGADVIVQPVQGRVKRLLVADMDSTMITIECIDELADYAGIKAEVAAVTEAAMRGELDFEAALDARVALLRDLDAAVIDRCHADRVRIMAGAKPLIATMRAHGARCVLVSGGFTVFADRVAAEIGFDRALSNVLEMADGRLAGTVARPIVGAATKRETLVAEAAALGLPLAATMAIGDGANDIPMIEAAGLGVAYHAKPRTAAAAAARIDHGDLSALLYAQGHARRDWVEG